MKKRDYILLRLIEEYIKHPEPVSSKRLQALLDFDISSATIRYYFKQLTEVGSLKKSHVSSGRIPTTQALSSFWRTRLKNDLAIDLAKEMSIEELASKKKIFCEYYTMKEKRLNSVERYKDYLIIKLEDEELLIRYNKNLERFLQNQIGRDSFELARICQEIGLVSFSNTLKRFLQKEFKICAIEEIVDIAKEDTEWAKHNLQDLLNGSKLYERSRGVTFEDRLLSYKFKIAKSKDKGEMLLLGKVHRDFGGFINTLKGADHGEETRA